MSIRRSLLAILSQGPCYGYQLRTEFERRTGGTWPLNVGQVYGTLDRLERDGLATKVDIAGSGHLYYQITEAGEREAHDWMVSTVTRPVAARDELAIKLALSVTLPGADPAAIIAAQRTATQAAIDELRAESSGSLARQIVIDSLICAAEGEMRWLDQCEAAIGRAAPFGLDEPPRRGRPRATVAR